MRAKPAIELSPAAARAIIGATVTGLPHEAGGILLGYGQGIRTVVTDVLVMASSRPSFDRFVRDDVAANELLAEYRSRPNANDAIGYVGEWHSHPSSVGPSSIDRAAILDTARSGGREVALVVFAPWAREQFHGLIASPSKKWRTIQPAKVVIEGEIAMPLDPLPTSGVRLNGPVFISYRHSDGFGRAEELERLLHAGGITVWRDVRDLPPGNTEDRIDQAITAGLSAAVLIVTPDIINSLVVRAREVPRLLVLAENQRFALVIASVVGRENGDRLNFDAPDVLLGLAPKRVLNAMSQLDVRTEKGRLEVVRGLLLHRIAQLKTDIASSDRPFVITTQSRVDTRSLDGDVADLDIRLIPAENGKLPAAQGVQDLMSTLPLVSDAVRTSGARSIRMSGGMHLSIALALGAAFPETRLGQIEVVDLQGAAWSSTANSSDPKAHSATAAPMPVIDRPDSTAPSKLGVFVSLTEAPDMSVFELITCNSAIALTSAIKITAGLGRLDPRESGRLAQEIASLIKSAARTANATEVHLAFHGPYTMAVLVGRLLNTLRTVVYEWVRADDGSAEYLPVVTLQLDIANGPITAVHI